jgi:hypothetical protein
MLLRRQWFNLLGVPLTAVWRVLHTDLTERLL